MSSRVVREGGAILSAAQGNVVLWSQNNILHGVSGDLRTNSAITFLGGHRMALGCFGLHANGCFNA